MNERIRICGQCGFILDGAMGCTDKLPPVGYTNVTHGRCKCCYMEEMLKDGMTFSEAMANIIEIEKTGVK